MQQATLTQHPVTSRGPRARNLQLGAAAVLAAALGALFAGCGSEAAPFCVGGFVRKAPTETDPGVCEGKCTAAACGADHACVDNKCVLTCETHRDCEALTQDCVPGQKDDDGNSISVCQGNGKGSIGKPCYFGDECGSAFACPDGKTCDPACTANCACPADQCKALFCRTTGMGDANAFCTLQDCHADADCPGGYWCAAVTAPQQICGTMTGDDQACGTTTDPCVDPANNASSGATFAEGSYCALRNECRPRGNCAPCETDLDCSGIAGQHCTTMALDGSKSCTRDCASDADCEVGFKCDTNACIPRYGSCVGKGNYCEPCRNELDCGGPGSKFSCRSFGGAERMCVDISASTSCMSDNDCPTGPDGRHGWCYLDDSSSSLYRRCYLPPLNGGSGHISCWCSNPGAACYTGDDCCSKKCVGAIPSQQYPGVCKP